MGSRRSRSLGQLERLSEQRKWEKQDRLEDWAREDSPGTAAAGRWPGRVEAGGKQGKGGEAGGAEVGGVRRCLESSNCRLGNLGKEKPGLLGSSTPDFQDAGLQPRGWVRSTHEPRSVLGLRLRPGASPESASFRARGGCGGAERAGRQGLCEQGWSPPPGCGKKHCEL